MTRVEIDTNRASLVIEPFGEGKSTPYAMGDATRSPAAASWPGGVAS